MGIESGHLLWKQLITGISSKTHKGMEPISETDVVELLLHPLFTVKDIIDEKKQEKKEEGTCAFSHSDTLQESKTNTYDSSSKNTYDKAVKEIESLFLQKRAPLSGYALKNERIITQYKDDATSISVNSKRILLDVYTSVYKEYYNISSIKKLSFNDATRYAIDEYIAEYGDWNFIINLESWNIPPKVVSDIESTVTELYNSIKDYMYIDATLSPSVDFKVATLTIYSLYANIVPKSVTCCKNFIGRESETQKIINLIDNNKLLIVTAPMGIGKKQAVKKALSSAKKNVYWAINDFQQNDKSLKESLEAYMTACMPNQLFRNIHLDSDESITCLAEGVIVFEKDTPTLEDMLYIERTLSDTNISCIVICSHSDGIPKKYTNLKLKHFTPEELLTLFKNNFEDYAQYMNDVQLFSIFEYMQFNTALVYLLSKALFSLKKKNTKEENSNNVNSNMQNHRPNSEFNRYIDSITQTFYKFWRLPSVPISDRQVFLDPSPLTMTRYIHEMLRLSEFDLASNYSYQLLPFFIRGSLKIEYLYRWYSKEEIDNAILYFTDKGYMNHIDEETIELPDFISDAIWDYLQSSEKQAILTNFKSAINTFLDDLQNGTNSLVPFTVLSDIAITILYRIRDAFPRIENTRTDNTPQDIWNDISNITNRILIFFIYTDNIDYARKASAVLYRKLDKGRNPLDFEVHYNKYYFELACYNAIISLRETKDIYSVESFIKKGINHSKKIGVIIQPWYLLIQEMIEYYIPFIEAPITCDQHRSLYIASIREFMFSFDTIINRNSFVDQDGNHPSDSLPCFSSYRAHYEGVFDFLYAIYECNSFDEQRTYINAGILCFGKVIHGECIVFESYDNGTLAESMIIYALCNAIHYLCRFILSKPELIGVKDGWFDSIQNSHNALLTLKNKDILLSSRLSKKISDAIKDYESFMEKTKQKYHIP